MTKPIPDRAEIALEYPDKLYVGAFERSSRFEAHVDASGISLMLEHPGTDDAVVAGERAGDVLRGLAGSYRVAEGAGWYSNEKLILDLPWSVAANVLIHMKQTIGQLSASDTSRHFAAPQTLVAIRA